MKFTLSAIALSLAAISAGSASAASYVGKVTAQTADFRFNAGDTLFSPNYRYMTLMQKDGHLLTYRMSDYKIIFSTGSSNNAGGYALLKQDHTLKVYNSGGGMVWDNGSRTSAPDPATTLSLTNDGMLVLAGAPWPGSMYPDTIHWVSPRDNYVASCSNGAPQPHQVCFYGNTVMVSACSAADATTFAQRNGGNYGSCQ